MKVFENKLQTEMEGLQINDQPDNMVSGDGATASGTEDKIRRGCWRRGNGNKCHMGRRRMHMFKQMMKNGGGVPPPWGRHGMSHHDMPPMMWSGYGHGPYSMYGHHAMGSMHGHHGGAPPMMFHPQMMMMMMMGQHGGHKHMWKHAFKGCSGENKKHMKKWWKHQAKQQKKDAKNSSSDEDEHDLPMGDSSESYDAGKQESPAGNQEHGFHKHRRGMNAYSGMFPGAMSYGSHMHPYGGPPPFVQAFIMRQMCKNRKDFDDMEKDQNETDVNKDGNECPTKQTESCNEAGKEEGTNNCIEAVKESFPRHMPKWKRAMIMNHYMMYGAPPPPFSPVWMNKKQCMRGRKCGKKHEKDCQRQEADENPQQENTNESVNVDMDAK